MKKSSLPCLLVALFSFSNCFSQKAPIKFGDVPMEDMQMSVYPSDSSAAAAILADYGVSRIVYQQNTGFQLKFERTTRVKILKKEGLDWATFEVPLFSNSNGDEKIGNIKGITYTLENGKVIETKLKNENIFREKTDANWQIVKVAFPGVKEGCVLDITYEVASDFFFNFQDWEFQTTIPTRWSEYRAYIPEYFQYEQYLQGYLPITSVESKSVPNSITLSYIERGGDKVTTHTAHNEKIDFQEKQHRWVIKDVPAFRDEPYMTSRKDYISKLNFELSFINMPNQPIKPMMGSWADINKSFYELYNPEIIGNNFLKKVVEESQLGTKPDEQTLASICNYVKKTVLWDGRNTKYLNSTLRKVLDEKKGNSAEINLLLASMLEKAGFSVHPVLISTRDHGLIRQNTPASTQFNYVACVVTLDDKQLLLDATERLLPFDLVPEKCLNGSGLVINKEAFSWISLESKFKARSLTKAEFTLTSDAQLDGKLHCDFTGYAALNKRKGYLVKGEETYVKEFIGSHAWEHQGSEFKNAAELSSTFTEEHKLRINENVTVSGDIVYIEPFIVDGLKSNPFKSEKREYPVNFGSPSEQTFMCNLTVPENMAIEELPSTKIFMLPGNAAKYVFNVVVNGNTINITSIFSINKSLFTQDEYPNLREFYNQVVAKQSEQIVLKKR